MKVFLAVLSLVILPVPAFADDRGVPYEQTHVDRGIPEQTLIHGRAATGASGAATASQTSPGGQGMSSVAVPAQPAASRSPWATGPWANDHIFVAPPL